MTINISRLNYVSTWVKVIIFNVVKLIWHISKNTRLQYEIENVIDDAFDDSSTNVIEEQNMREISFVTVISNYDQEKKIDFFKIHSTFNISYKKNNWCYYVYFVGKVFWFIIVIIDVSVFFIIDFHDKIFASKNLLVSVFL